MAIKILSVDDELDMEMLIQQRFRRQIRDKRFEFVFAHNGSEALEKLSEDKGIDMILSDINMPGMDGLTFLSKINDLSNPLLKAVMVSAYGDMENIRTAMNRGAFDFITKPINFDDLEITINKTIEHIEMMVQLQKGRDQYIAIQKDLQIANGIQQSMLPKKFPAFPNRTDVDLHAFLEPAKTVGGDLFDFFTMDDERLFFIIGDVSDKGIPAALFMAITKAIFKSHFANEACGDICTEVRQVNKFLCEDNSSFMFVTAFLGILNLRTGEIEYVDAGHEPPIILRKGIGVEVMKKHGGLALAIDDSYEYVSQTVTLNPGDALFLYTDGATDANNLTGQRFGLERLQHLVAPFTDIGAPRDINDLFYKEIKDFIGEAAQFDDITVMTIRYNGPQ